MLSDAISISRLHSHRFTMVVCYELYQRQLGTALAQPSRAGMLLLSLSRHGHPVIRPMSLSALESSQQKRLTTSLKETSHNHH